MGEYGTNHMAYIDGQDPLYNPELDHAINEHPFETLLQKYHKAGLGPLTSEQLDELAVDLEVSPYMKRLEAELAKSPALSALYRYDPFSIRYRKTFAGTMSTGPRKAWLRMFKDLTFDKVEVVRTDNEALVVINHPAVVIMGLGSTMETTDPTVLFTSRIFNAPAFNLHEQDVYGLSFTHGQTAHEVLPKTHTGLSNASIVLAYYQYARDEREKNTP